MQPGDARPAEGADADVVVTLRHSPANWTPENVLGEVIRVRCRLTKVGYGQRDCFTMDLATPLDRLPEPLLTGYPAKVRLEKKVTAIAEDRVSWDWLS